MSLLCNATVSSGTGNCGRAMISKAENGLAWNPTTVNGFSE